MQDFLFFPCVHAKRGYGPNHSLQRLWKLWIKIVAKECDWRYACFVKKAFPEQVGPWIPLLERIDFFGKKEYCTSVVKKKKKKNLKEQYFDGEANWLGVVSCHRILMSLVMSTWFIFRNDLNDVPCSSCFCSPAMMLFLLSRGPWFSCIYICILNQFRRCQIWYKK